MAKKASSKSKAPAAVPAVPDLSYIAEGLRPLAVPLEEIKPDARNARKHDKKNLDAIRSSLKRYGQRQPLVVNRLTGTIEAGNARFQVAGELGWTHVAVVYVEDDPKSQTGFALADNRTAELATWDDALLAELLGEVKEAGDEDLVAELQLVTFLAKHEEKSALDDATVDESEAAKLLKKWKVKPGDLWTIEGKQHSHRILCGDSTSEESFERLLQGDKAKLLCTDPPYGVDYSKTKNGMPVSGFRDQSERWGDIANDDLQDAKLQAFLESVFRAASKHLDRAAWYLWHAHLTQGFFAAAAASAAEVILHRQIIWKKPSLVLTRSGMYHWQHEPCFFGWVKGKQPQWLGDKSQTSVWELGRDGDAMHPTQKPVELFAIPIRNHLKPGEIALEPFSGSGSQLVAAEQLGRRCYAIELAPKYVSVALERMERLGCKCKKV